MQRSRLPSVARQLLKEVPDGELLERYRHKRADDAFAQLVSRYSRLVWGQCRNLLPDDADADDAFQATFLTLARSVGKLKPGAPLGPWLHGVAFRVCKNARRANGRRAKHEKATARPEATRPIADSAWEGAFAAATEELQKLPEAERTAFVLCYLEGRTAINAAATLGVKPGTFATRLSRAKQKLLDRLAKRGLGAAVLAFGGVAGTVAIAPAALIERTLALIPSGVTVPSSILTLTHGVTGMMMIRFKVLAAGVMIATGLGLSVGSGWYGSATAQVPDLSEVGGLPAKAPPAKAASNIDEIKAKLAKVQAELAEAQKKDVTGKKAPATQLGVQLEQPKSKYEYEPVPATHKDFEAKLAAREQAGWSFVGEVTFHGTDKETLMPTLVFREKLKSVMWLDLTQPSTRLYSTQLEHFKVAEELFRQVQPVPPPQPAAPPSQATPQVLRPGGVSSGLGGVSGGSQTQPLIPPGTSLPADIAVAGELDLSKQLRTELDRLKKLDAENNGKIASLMVIVEALQRNAELGAKGNAVKPKTVTFGPADIGKWKSEELLDVINQLMQANAKKYSGTVEVTLGTDSIVLSASPEYLADFGTWVKKLKK